jgi:hypothetical protein
MFCILSFVFNCSEKVEGKDKKIKQLPKFENPVEGSCIIRYSNIIMTVAGKNIKVPMYGGIYEDITYDDLEKQLIYKNYYLLGEVVINTPKGKVKETFLDVLKFYKKSFFKNIDVNKPSVIGNEGSDWMLIWYDFNYEGLPCSMMIKVECETEATPVDGTIDMLVFKENYPVIILEINIGKSSSFKKFFFTLFACKVFRWNIPMSNNA